SAASTAGPPVTKDKAPKTDAVTVAKGEESVVKSNSDVILKGVKEKVNADTAATKVTAVPKDITADATANAETTTPENKAEEKTKAVNETVMETIDTKSVKKEHEAGSSVPMAETKSESKELEVESSAPTLESVVTVKSEDKELEIGSSVPSSETVVSVDFGKAELKTESSAPASESVLIESANTEHEVGSSESAKTELVVASAVSASESADSVESAKTKLDDASTVPSGESAVTVESSKAEYELASSDTSISMDTTDQTETLVKKNDQNVLQAEDVPKELVSTSVEESKNDNVMLEEDNNVESKSEMEIVASTVSSEEPAVEAMETQSSEEPTKDTDVKEEVLETPTEELKIGNESQSNDMKPTEPIQTDINPQSSNKTEPTEEHGPAAVASDSIPTLDPASDLPSTSDQTVSNSSATVTCASNSPQTMLEPFQIDDKSLDFPPVTQEILKALELAVHQCRLQSSLRRAEEEARQKAEMEKKAAEKKTTKAPSSSKKPAQATKKTTQAESKKIQAEKKVSLRTPHPQRESQQLGTGAGVILKKMALPPGVGDLLGPPLPGGAGGNPALHQSVQALHQSVQGGMMLIAG
ncbi:hypothetical protein M9458_016481, partial [Cirrhinus mrigala]